ncbi:hypothetical protein [Algicola sagamiensis]|uniref:hypothetical protein n=1 Tax=Algicola sagamiensis TaxID=163869 RepID=UPI00037F58B6|nr:hypothetical protein [Algicola sagamiensis]
MKLKSLLALSALSLSLLYVSQHEPACTRDTTTESHVKNGQHLAPSADVSTDICHAQASNQSWFAWFTGSSRSFQFHFVDLFELMNFQPKRRYQPPANEGP